ncbi:MAG: ParB N-terminal domain-containing protein [Proteobacteria bacterium]|nr:ParB N-terminal domain-containing protein [Pseudomonadota bacterium]
MTAIALGFVPEPITVSLDRILPSRKVPAGLATSRKFRQVKSSIEEVGLIEPLSVAALDAVSGHHLLLDGHVRLVALQALGHASAPCLVAKDDEGYTYNNRINRLSTVQEHFMIRRAIERGVSQERLAKALGVDVSQIAKKVNLLEGICPEAVELFKDRQFSVELGRVLRKMKPTRQVECAELMLSANNLTVAYAEALLVATPAHALVSDKRARKISGVTPDQMARMEREMANLQGQYRLVEQCYGQDVLNLVLAKGYLIKLMENALVAKFLKAKHPDMHEQFVLIAAAVSLD